MADAHATVRQHPRSLAPELVAPFTTLLIRLGDDGLVLGHRLSEWCGHAPMLEEDLSMPNMALDLIGQARLLYSLAAELEGQGRCEDDIAYLRTDRDYVNCLLVERANGDFAHTMLRQFYFSVFMRDYWQAACRSTHGEFAAIAAKSVKEMSYHVRHAGEWVIRLGDGSEESARRMAEAVTELHPYTGELFEVDDVTRALGDAGVAPDPAALRSDWEHAIATVFDAANLTVPTIAVPYTGGRQGRHGEDFGFLLAELQYMQRTYPGMQW